MGGGGGGVGGGGGGWCCFFFFKQKTAYEIGTGDWSSDVCSSDLIDWYRMLISTVTMFQHRFYDKGHSDW